MSSLEYQNMRHMMLIGTVIGNVNFDDLIKMVSGRLQQLRQRILLFFIVIN